MSTRFAPGSAIATALPRRHVEHCMGTVFSIDVRAPGVDACALERVIAWLHSVDALFSPYRADSAVSRLGRGELDVADCPAVVRAVLARCAELQAQTAGYFSAYPAGRLDPSGYVKGWAIERAADLLVEAGSRNHCVNGGGDVQCVGQARPGEPWRIGIADPRDPARLIGVATGTRLAVATSGTAERGAHILDPHTGRPPTGLLSVTVIGTHLAEVDAWATAAFAMGERARAWSARGAGQWLLVEVDGTSAEPQA